MGHIRRQLALLHKSFTKKLKEPIENVALLMPQGFSDEQFVAEFVRCYGYLWDEMTRERQSYSRWIRKCRNKKMPIILRPYQFVLSCGNHRIKRIRRTDWVTRSREEQEKLRETLVAECKRKIEDRQRRVETSQRFLQKIAPSYLDSMIQSYFYTLHHNREDVNSRYYVLREVGKFFSEQNVGFLKWVMVNDRNDTIREEALHILQRWNITAHLPPKRRGKRHHSDAIVPDNPETPEALLEQIKTLQMEKGKTYDVFLSHRYADSGRLLKIMRTLNGQGFSVYMDWVIDRDELQRSMFGSATMEVLKLRIKHCNTFLYVHTENCAGSICIPQEITFAKECGMPIFVLNVDGSDEGMDTGGLPHVSYSDLERKDVFNI